VPFTQIQHVFVLMLENRSFDHMLGAVPLPGADVAAPGSFVNVDAQGTRYRNAVGAPDVMPADPPHEYDDVVLQLLGGNTDPPYNYNPPLLPITGSGFVRSYGSAATGDLSPILSMFDPAGIPFLAYLAREYCVCDRWFSSLPGPTLPNRLFLCAASSKGDPKSPSDASIFSAEFIDGYSFANGDVFKRFKEAGNLGFRIYRGDALPFTALLDGVDFQNDTVAYTAADFAADCSAPDLPPLVFIEPSYDIFNGYKSGTSQHPCSHVSSGDRLVSEVYTALVNSKAWASSVLLITYDEHGGFFDHVGPPPAVPPNDAPNVYDFHFDRLGVRVPAVVVSPLLTQRRSVDHTVRDHTSFLATLNRLFPQVGTFTSRDRAAAALDGLFAGPADPSPIAPPPPAYPPAAPLALAAAAGQGSPGAPPSPPGAARIALPDDAQPLEHPEVVGLKIAGKLHHEVLGTPKDAVLSEIRSKRTKGDARDYMRKIHAALAARPTGRRR
jgi:phospholipase C